MSANATPADPSEPLFSLEDQPGIPHVHIDFFMDPSSYVYSGYVYSGPVFSGPADTYVLTDPAGNQWTTCYPKAWYWVNSAGGYSG